MIRKNWRVGASLGVLALATIALAPVAYRAMFSFFAPHDDEGYMLISLHGYSGGSALYDDVYSQYGPGYFVLVGGLFRLLSLTYDQDTARLVTLCMWVGTTFLVGLILLRLTRNAAIAVSGLLLSWLLLSVATNEPLHPGNELIFLLAALVAIVVLLLPARPRAAMLSVGAIAAAMTMMKINIGAFVFVAFAFAFAAAIPTLRRSTPILALASALFVATPFLVIGSELSHGWAVQYATVVSLGALAIAVVSLGLPPTPFPALRHVAWFAIGAAAMLLLVVTVPVIRGTSVGGLIDGVVFAPLGSASKYSSPPGLRGDSIFLGMLGLAAAVYARRWIVGRDLAPRLRGLVGCLRIAVGLVIWVAVSVVVDPRGLAIGAPLIWVAAIPTGDDGAPKASFPRVLLPSLAVLQLLQAFPIPGSQLDWSELLLVVIGGICIGDGIDDLVAWARAVRPNFRASRLAATVPVVIFGLWFGTGELQDQNSRVNDTYRSGVPLNIPAAHRLRLPADQTAYLERLTGTLKRDCRTFITLPGLDGLYFFTGEPPPTQLNGSAWMYQLDSDDQRRVVAQIRERRGLCAVRNRFLLQFWSALGPLPDRPLVRYIRRNFATVDVIGGYEVMLRKGSPARAGTTRG